MFPSDHLREVHPLDAFLNARPAVRPPADESFDEHLHAPNRTVAPAPAEAPHSAGAPPAESPRDEEPVAETTSDDREQTGTEEADAERAEDATDEHPDAAPVSQAADGPAKSRDAETPVDPVVVELTEATDDAGEAAETDGKPSAGKAARELLAADADEPAPQASHVSAGDAAAQAAADSDGEPDAEPSAAKTRRRAAANANAPADETDNDVKQRPTERTAPTPTGTSTHASPGNPDGDRVAPIDAGLGRPHRDAAGSTAAEAGAESESSAPVLRAGGAEPSRSVEAPRGGTPNETARISQAEQGRLVQRVAGAFRVAQARGGHLRLRLSPPQLGSLRMELTVQSGVLAARLETENATARNVLLDNLPILRERLAEQGIRVERFDVEVMDRRGQETPQQTDQQPGRDPRRSNSGTHPNSESSTTSPDLAGPQLPTNTGLNVIV